MNKKDLILALTSGLLLCLSFPKANLGILIWIALVPLLYALRDKNLQNAFHVGFIAGFLYNAGLVYWIVYVVAHYGHLPLYAGVSVMFLLVIYLSIYPALFCLGVAYFLKRGVRAVLIAPPLWTALEYVKAHLFSGFPWEDLAYSQHGQLPLIQIADITGPYGITFLIVLVNCIVYDCVIGFFPPPWGKRRLPTSEIVIGAVLMALVVGYGMYRIDTLKDTDRDFNPVNVLIVQGNIDQSVKWTPEFQTKTLDIYRNMSVNASKKGVSLIVWPETAVPFYFQNDDELSRGVVDVTRGTGAWMLFGSPSYERGGERVSFYNSAYLLSPAGHVAGRYDKVHLVPFGEYVPLQNVLFFIDKLVAGAGDFKPGGGIVPLAMGDHTIGPLICYEAIFPEISREHRLRGAELLVNITNDAWYGNTSAPYQHLTMAIYRAIENRTYLIRAANTGISAIVNPAGEIVSRTGLFEREVLDGTVEFTRHRTLYSRYGNVFTCFCMGFLLMAFPVSLRRKKI